MRGSEAKNVTNTKRVELSNKAMVIERLHEIQDWTLIRIALLRVKSIWSFRARGSNSKVVGDYTNVLAHQQWIYSITDPTFVLCGYGSLLSDRPRRILFLWFYPRRFRLHGRSINLYLTIWSTLPPTAFFVRLIEVDDFTYVWFP